MAKNLSEFDLEVYIVYHKDMEGRKGGVAAPISRDKLERSVSNAVKIGK